MNKFDEYMCSKCYTRHSLGIDCTVQYVVPGAYMPVSSPEDNRVREETKETLEAHRALLRRIYAGGRVWVPRGIDERLLVDLLCYKGLVYLYYSEEEGRVIYRVEAAGLMLIGNMPPNPIATGTLKRTKVASAFEAFRESAGDTGRSFKELCRILTRPVFDKLKRATIGEDQ